MSANAPSPRVIVIIQARMGSTRLPGKSMLSLGRKTVIQSVVGRVRRARLVDQVIVAIPDTPDNDRLEQHLSELAIPCYRGSETDVLDRYYRCAREYLGDNVVRVTGDAPLMAPEVIDLVIKEHLQGECDYTSNGWGAGRTFPLGFDVRIMTAAVLERVQRQAREPYDREHVTTYIHAHLPDFNYRIVTAPEVYHYPELKLVVDSAADYLRLQGIVAALGPDPVAVATSALLDYIRPRPSEER